MNLQPAELSPGRGSARLLERCAMTNVTRLAALGGALLRWPRAASWALCSGWYGAIWALSEQPGRAEPGHGFVSVLSNGAHGPLFGLLACWLALLVPRRAGWPVLSAAVRGALLLGIAALGTLDELHQSFTPRRDFSLLDVLTDVAGAAAALEIVAFLGRERPPPRGLALRLGLAAAISLACGALASFLPRCFPSVGWF